jgi:guanine deaminase
VSIVFSDKPYFDTIPFLEEFLPDVVRKDLVASQQTGPDTILALWNEYGRKWQGRVGFVLSPSGPQRSSDQFLKETARVSNELDLPIIIHVLETKVQEITGYLFYNRSLVEHMKSINILSRRTNLVHCVWVNDRDIELIARSEASVIHNPVSNLKLGSGIAPIAKMLKAGINIGLGTDNNNANDSANIMEAMKTGALINKVTDCDYDNWIGAKEVLQMATYAGARCIGLENEIGELEKGKKADFVIFDLNSLPFIPRHNLLHQLVFCENGESIETVVIDGRIVYDNGKILTFNEDKIKAKVQEKSEIISDKIINSACHAKEIQPYVEKAYRKCIRLSQLRPIG